MTILRFNMQGGRLSILMGTWHVYAILGLKTRACDQAPLGNPTTFLFIFRSRPTTTKKITLYFLKAPRPQIL
jgi:hypothetical protein